jgi:hypothetical protein
MLGTFVDRVDGGVGAREGVAGDLPSGFTA